MKPKEITFVVDYYMDLLKRPGFCIFGPRQTGKTTAAIQTYIEYPNFKIVCMSEIVKGYIIKEHGLSVKGDIMSINEWLRNSPISSKNEIIFDEMESYSIEQQEYIIDNFDLKKYRIITTPRNQSLTLHKGLYMKVNPRRIHGINVTTIDMSKLKVLKKLDKI